VRDLLVELTERLHPDLIVVACNTASTVALPALRNALSLPIVGTVPAIKPAAQTSVTRVIGLLGTPARCGGNIPRCSSTSSRRLHRAAAWLHRTRRTGGTEAVRRIRRSRRRQARARRSVRPAAASASTPVVLACTHFPLLAAELAAGAPRPLHWIDSGAAIARRVASLLDVAVASADAPPRHRAHFLPHAPLRSRSCGRRWRCAVLEEIEFVDS